MMRICVAALLMVLPFASSAQEGPVYGAELEGFEYPYPVKYYAFQSQAKALRMAYLDVAPEGAANGRTAVLMHGKNFCAAAWAGTIQALTKAGFRVVAPDQIGFCKSTKPDAYQFSFHQLAANTRALLDSLSVEKVTVMGHRAYQKATYYVGEWKTDYDKWVDMQAGMYRGEGKKIVAWNSALTYEMIYTQPVYYEFEQLKMPVLLLIGEKDNTAIGKALAPAELRKNLGLYAKLGKDVAARIPNAKLITFEDLGHSPQIQAPERFHEALLQGLAK